jgi:leader peptidase (prepilin peptidase)/N-methyltransferase
MGLYLYTLVVGLAIGSFLNVCIWRLPRNESLIAPASHCPSCNRPIAIYDNIPVISFLWLRGRCRNCHQAIPWRYPIVELTNGLGYVVLVGRYGLTGSAVIYAAFFSALLVITLIDLDHQIIPDRITLPGIVIGLISASTVLATSLLDAIAGIILGGGLLLIAGLVGTWVLKKEAMGMGDVKLLAMIGAFLGWKAVLLTVLIGSLVGTLIQLVLMAFKLWRRGEYFAFGPYLSLGAMVSLFWGQEIIEWYWTFALLDKTL